MLYEVITTFTVLIRWVTTPGSALAAPVNMPYVWWATGSMLVITSYSIHYTKLYDNTWDGTGKIPFAGKITDVGSTTDANGVFSATETGTVYLVIRGGGSNMGDGISITNIEFRGISQ